MKKILGLLSPNSIGIDLGTTNSLVYVPSDGIVLNEPSVVAVSSIDESILAIGGEAREMIGKTPDSIFARRPLRDGVIADYRVAEAMIRSFIDKVCGRVRIKKPEVMISVPSGATSTERRAVTQATMRAGASSVFVVKEPVLAAIGAGIPINSPAGNMIVDIGGGTTEAAILSLGGIVANASLRVGGDKIDESIIDYVRRAHNIFIGERAAEKIKIEIGSALPQKDESSIEISGRDIKTGLPRNIVLYSNEITEAISGNIKEITQTVKEVLRETPPEISADIMDRGMVLSGGSAFLRFLDKLLRETTGVPVYVAEDPMSRVVQGAGMALENIELYKRSVMNSRE